MSRKFQGQQAAVLDQMRTRYQQFTAAEAERPGSSDATLGEIAVSLSQRLIYAREQAATLLHGSGMTFTTVHVQLHCRQSSAAHCSASGRERACCGGG